MSEQNDQDPHAHPPEPAESPEPAEQRHEPEPDRIQEAPAEAGISARETDDPGSEEPPPPAQ